MTTSDKLREIAEKWARPINSPHDDEEATQEVLSDLTALISEGYVSKEEHEAEIKRLLHCGSCGEPLSRDCPKCQHLWQT